MQPRSQGRVEKDPGNELEYFAADERDYLLLARLNGSTVIMYVQGFQ